MGYNSSGLIVSDTENFSAGTLDMGEAYIQWLRTKLLSVGWTAEKILAHTRLIVPLGIVAGDKVVVGGFTFTFITQPDEPFGVTIQGSVLATLENLGNHTRDDIDWGDFTVGTMTVGILFNVPYIEWTVPDYPDPPDPSFDGNIEIMEIIPHAALGFFDYNPESVGHGRSYGGGFLFTSLPHLYGGTIQIRVVTSGTNICDITFTSGDFLATFDGIAVADLWRVIANPYQFMLFVSGDTTARHFLLCSSLYPYGDLTQANFIAGPTAPNPGGANRGSLSGIGVHYYVDVSGAYAADATGNTSQTPNFVFPGWGRGITPTEKLGNKIAGIDIKRDNGHGIPFEAFVATCVTTPTSGPIGSDKIYIIGSLWDAFISSVHVALDSIETVNGKNTYVVLTQVGSQDVSRGSLLVQIES